MQHCLLNLAIQACRKYFNLRPVDSCLQTPLASEVGVHSLLSGKKGLTTSFSCSHGFPISVNSAISTTFPPQSDKLLLLGSLSDNLGFQFIMLGLNGEVF